MNFNQISKRCFSRNVVIVGAKRTPIGGFMGALKTIPAP